MEFFTKTGFISLALGVYKKNKRGDKARFIKHLLGAGFKGDLNEAWKRYTGTL